MIQVTYDRARHRLVVKGHAGRGPAGHDLVCAAVSALTLTLGANVADLATEGRLRRQTLRLEPGDCWIACVPEKNLKPVITLLFDTICTGFELLETLYPDNIRYSIR